jgi:hypothetical protein
VIGNASSGGTGIYCITLDPSVDASTATIQTTADYSSDSTGTGYIAIVEAKDAATNCGAGNKIEIIALEENTATGAVHGHNESFYFMVP